MNPAAVNAPLQFLLLEDSRFDAELLRESLAESHPDMALTWVTDEHAFTQALDRQRFDVILSDFKLPGWSGAEAMEHALEVSPDTPFIFVSGVIGEENAVDLMKRGATDYVIKGRLTRLAFAVDRALREVRQREAQRHIEAQLHEADALYGRVVDSLQDYAVVLLDARGRIRTWNRAAEGMFGHALAAVAGQPAHLLLPAEDRAEGVLERELAAALANGSATDERWLVTASGSRLRGETVVTPLFGAQGGHTGFSKIVRDVTRTYEAQEALRLSKEEAERANQSKDRFLAVLSHELRTPLAPITAAANVLERMATVPEKYQHLLPMIRRNVALEARLIDDLLDLTAITADKIKLQLEPVNIHDLAQRVLEMLAADIEGKGLQVQVDPAANRPLVMGDAARLQQVLWNVLRNAVKFTPEGGAIFLRTWNDGERVVAQCRDTGLGIAPEAMVRIFQPFQQSDDEQLKRLGGLGLGLAIAQGLVQRHGGTLTAQSPGRNAGATFELALPRAEAASADPPAASASATLHALPATPRRILLVEDSADAAQAMADALRSFGHEVVHATCQRDALALFAVRHDFDIAVTDIGLPDGNGVDLGRTLMQRMPVIALSGYGMPADRAKSANAGFVAHLVKPADPSEVQAMVQQALAQPQAGANRGG